MRRTALTQKVAAVFASLVSTCRGATRMVLWLRDVKSFFFEISRGTIVATLEFFRVLETV